MSTVKSTPKSVKKSAIPESPSGFTPEQASQVHELLRENYQFLYDLMMEALGPDFWYDAFVGEGQKWLSLSASGRIREFEKLERLREFSYKISDLNLFPLER